MLSTTTVDVVDAVKEAENGNGGAHEDESSLMRVEPNESPRAGF